MVIISPSQFSSSLAPLIDHKNNFGIHTFLKTTEEIYDEYQGSDKQEQIKYFIKDSIEDYGIKHVMLVGDVNNVPMRKCAMAVITGIINWHEVLSDLYYSDIYDSSAMFSSWDTNNNEKYCECYYDYYSNPIISETIDTVDMYPDVRIGRLPCKTIDECELVVDKIIHYESSIDEKNWFNNIILMGGDTTPDYESALEGEWLHETYIGPEMYDHGFHLTKLYASLDLFTPEDINNEINAGAGFLSYAGHGYMDYIATSPPLENTTLTYTINDFDELNNEYRLPICFLDACLTGKIDFDLFDKIMIPLTVLYPNSLMYFLKRVADEIETFRYFPCFASSLLLTKSRGAIAVIAATQPSLSGFAIDNGDIIDIVFGSSNLNRFFFESYNEDILLSDMIIQTQNNYINNIRSPESFVTDYVTVNEFNLYGDPSLKIGGFT